MIEKKFNVPKEFQLERNTNDIEVKLREILGVELTSYKLKPQVPGYKGVTYVISGSEVYISIRYDPDAVKVDRPGLSVYISADKEEQVYLTLIDILGLNG